MSEVTTKRRGLWAEAWRRFKKNKLALVGMSFIILLLVIAISTIVIDLVTNKSITHMLSSRILECA